MCLKRILKIINITLDVCRPDLLRMTVGIQLKVLALRCYLVIVKIEIDGARASFFGAMLDRGGI